jgi:hypothetical protein
MIFINKFTIRSDFIILDFFNYFFMFGSCKEKRKNRIIENTHEDSEKIVIFWLVRA